MLLQVVVPQASSGGFSWLVAPCLDQEGGDVLLRFVQAVAPHR